YGIRNLESLAGEISDSNLSLLGYHRSVQLARHRAGDGPAASASPPAVPDPLSYLRRSAVWPRSESSWAADSPLVVPSPVHASCEEGTDAIYFLAAGCLSLEPI